MPDDATLNPAVAAAPVLENRSITHLLYALDTLPVLAFLTDPLNRIQWVNRRFAATVGDPARDGLTPEQRFLHAAIAGPYRHRFPRWKQELSNCLAELEHEVEAGRLAAGTKRLIERTFERDAELRRASESPVAWDGTMLRAPDDKLTLVHEQVVPLVNTDGRPSGLHLTQWFPGDYAPSTDPEDLALRLTPRQIEIAGYFASGLTAAEVAQHAGISSRTARDHLEDIYSRLEVHSRSQLVLVLVRAGLIQPGRP